MLEYPGHIACDSAARSELVIPIYAGGGIAGVLDLDSPQTARFDQVDAARLRAERADQLFSGLQHLSFGGLRDRIGVAEAKESGLGAQLLADFD